ncbi:hypothetical protein EON63_02365 [archaeon]|nr:MAG: hypothetical protein EON63_02365 [archaeon]
MEMKAFVGLLIALSAVGATVYSNIGGEYDEDIRYGFNEYRDRCTSIGVGKIICLDAMIHPKSLVLLVETFF